MALDRTGKIPALRDASHRFGRESSGWGGARARKRGGWGGARVAPFSSARSHPFCRAGARPILLCAHPPSGLPGRGGWAAKSRDRHPSKRSAEAGCGVGSDGEDPGSARCFAPLRPGTQWMGWCTRPETRRMGWCTRRAILACTLPPILSCRSPSHSALRAPALRFSRPRRLGRREPGSSPVKEIG